MENFYKPTVFIIVIISGLSGIFLGVALTSLKLYHYSPTVAVSLIVFLVTFLAALRLSYVRLLICEYERARNQKTP